MDITLLPIREFSFAMTIDDTDSDIYFKSRHSVNSYERYGQAIDDIHNILRRKPEDGDSYYLLKDVYQNQGDTLE